MDGIKGIYASHFAHWPAFGGIKGIYASHFANWPALGGIKGIFGETPLSRSPQYKTGTCRSYALYFA
ncbi:hypothetical protein, partial [Paenibacillus sp. FSL R7-0273]|uniref:hypothetical protein n=1 Tax=Paenibacillus sp. FSL R7-0273 TaxID=1536772 RepID=UPI001C4D29A3